MCTVTDLLASIVSVQRPVTADVHSGGESYRHARPILIVTDVPSSTL
jgi:hypothetical protein